MTTDNIMRTWIQPAPSTPASLATASDLGEEAAQVIADALNSLIADAFALYVKTKNFHWHLFGPHFRDYHLLFDEQAEQILGSIDDLAERVRKVGGSTIRSISHIAQLQTIRDDNQAAVPAHEMLQYLVEDNAHLVKQQRAAHAVCEEARDVATASLLETIIDQTERRIWFLFETLRDGHRA
jgi:starvation-inducible DNA-binding protein